MKDKIALQQTAEGFSASVPVDAPEADIGIAGGKGVGILYRKGEVVRRVKESEIVDAIVEEVPKFQPA